MSHTKDTVSHQLADLVLHRFDLGRVQRSGGQTEIGQLDVTGRVDQKVLRKGSFRQPSRSICRKTAGIAYLWFQVSMNVTEFVQLAHSHEHLGRVESSVFLLEHSRVVQQGPEISTRDVFLRSSSSSQSAGIVPTGRIVTSRTHHGEVHVIPVLKRIQQADQPRRLGRRQNVPLDQDVLDFVHLGQRRLFHLFQRAHFARIGLAGEKDGSIASLTDLSVHTQHTSQSRGSSRRPYNCCSPER